MVSQYEHGPDFQTPNEAEIDRLNATITALRDRVAEVERERDALLAKEDAYSKCRDLSKQGWSALSDARMFLLHLKQPDDINEAAQCIDVAQASFADTIISSERRATAAEAAIARLRDEVIEECAKWHEDQHAKLADKPVWQLFSSHPECAAALRALKSNRDTHHETR